MLLPPPDISAAYVDDKQRPSKDLYNWIKSLYDVVRGLVEIIAAAIVGNTLFAPVVAVADLPPAGVIGRRHFVNDSNTATFADVVVGGGGLNVPVFDDGTDWRVG